MSFFGDAVANADSSETARPTFFRNHLFFRSASLPRYASPPPPRSSKSDSENTQRERRGETDARWGTTAPKKVLDQNRCSPEKMWSSREDVVDGDAGEWAGQTLVSAPTQEDQGDDDQGDGGHPGMLVGDASQDGIQSQKIPLGHDVRWHHVGVDRVVWVAEGDWGSERDAHEMCGADQRR